MFTRLAEDIEGMKSLNFWKSTSDRDVFTSLFLSLLGRDHLAALDHLLDQVLELAQLVHEVLPPEKRRE